MRSALACTMCSLSLHLRGMGELLMDMSLHSDPQTSALPICPIVGQPVPETIRKPELANVGVVVIGRNEGERLVRCLGSLGRYLDRTIYVDSGSSDGSPIVAKQMGAIVVPLDMRTPFTAARARNAGLDALMQRWPGIVFVQFVDGDCELDASWIEAAHAFLSGSQDVAIVFGRRRERYPEASIYNALCDREWNGTIGKALECGGDIFTRADLISKFGGYAGNLIAGEEPELCVRLREKGWIIWRLDCEMTLHDANIVRLSQWWRRSVRAGHAFAEVSLLHRSSPFGIWRLNTTRAVFWAFALPCSAIAGAFASLQLLTLLGLYPLQIVRLASRQGVWLKESWRNALFDVLGKFAELQGVAQFHVNRLLKRRRAIIEYK